MAKGLIWEHVRKITIFNIFIYLKNLLCVFEILFTMNTREIQKKYESWLFFAGTQNLTLPGP